MTSPLEQKKLKVRGPVVVTANRLGDGAVVYRSDDGGWATSLAAAAVVTTAQAADALLAAANADGVRAVGPYVAPVEITEDRRVLPGNLRERIRVQGPTIALPPITVVQGLDGRSAVSVRRLAPEGRGLG